VDKSLDPVSYHALRVREESVAVEWWASAHDHRHDAPPAIQALLSGRTRVEVSATEADEAIQWAARLPGWNHDGPTPLYVHPPTADQPRSA
jgi:hypothetical protein